MKIENCIEYISKNHPNLKCNVVDNKIVGNISFSRNYKGCPIEDNYNIKIDFNNIPSESILPKVFITDNKIEKIAEDLCINKKDLHLNDNDSFCMCIYDREKEYFPDGFNNINIFFEKLIEPYLYWVSYYKIYRSKPWSEYAHGDLGYLELYAENEIDLLGLTQSIDKKKLLKYKNMTGHHICLCGTKYKIRDCHSLILKVIYTLKEESLSWI